METDELRRALESAGLTQYEAAAYVALVELGSAQAVEVAEASDVPQARIYDILRELEREGYIETYEHGNLEARAHDPTEVLEDLHEYAETIETAAAEIKQRWEQPRVENHRVSIVKRIETVLDRAAEAIEDAENEIQIAATPKHFERLRDELAAAKEAGVVVKLTLTPESRGDPDIERFEADFPETATEVRYCSIPTPFLVLVDRMQVSFAPETSLHPSREYGVLVNDYSLSQVFDWYFQTAVWDYWDVVYSDRDSALPAEYTNLRECIRAIDDFVDAGQRVVVTVDGESRLDDEHVTITGEVTDLVYTDEDESDTPPLASFVETASITIRTGDGTEYEVGGWGALFEDIEASRIVVEAVD